MNQDIFQLSGFHRGFLRKRAQQLKPVVMLGQAGLTPALTNAIDEALKSHELVKLKFQDFKDEKREISEEIARVCSAQFIRLIGNILILFRQNPEKKDGIRLPKRDTKGA